jgi:hypothetical protein
MSDNKLPVTAEEVLEKHFVDGKDRLMQCEIDDGIVPAMQEFSSLQNAEVIAKLKEREWISVKDRLPEDGQTVLTVTDEGWFRIITAGSIGSGLPERVTHWQLLPSPPNEK